MASNMRLVATSLLLGGVCLGAGFYAGRASSLLRGPASNSVETKTDAEARTAIYSSYPHVQDAMRRWAAKDGLSIEKAMEERSIEMMYFPDRHCVEFNLPLGSVGGVPVYCYRVERSGGVPRPTTELVYEYSDVE